PTPAAATVAAEAATMRRRLIKRVVVRLISCTACSRQSDHERSMAAVMWFRIVDGRNKSRRRALRKRNHVYPCIRLRGIPGSLGAETPPIALFAIDGVFPFYFTGYSLYGLVRRCLAERIAQDCAN